MGRAIDMEKDIDSIKSRLNRLERTLKGIAYTLDELEGKSSKTKHIDIVEKTKQKESDEKKETNNEGSGKSSGKSNKRNKTNKS